MKEDFLHFIWQHRLYDAARLTTTVGDGITVLQTGFLNHSSGPDFSEARIGFDQTTWAGSVEIHLRSSDWFAHGHDSDSAYDNVILHVVYEHDREVTTTTGDVIPTLELKGRIRKDLLVRYGQLQKSKSEVPCAKSLPDIPTIFWRNWLDRVLAERLERKAGEVELHLKHHEGHWLQVYYTLLAGYLGGNWNKLPMFELTRRVPLRIIGLYKDDPLKPEALLLGTAGWIPEDSQDPYVRLLKREFEHLSNKYSIQPLHQIWKTGRIRPDNAPVHRIVQLSGLCVSMEEAFEQLIEQGAYDWQEVPLSRSAFWDHNLGFAIPRRNMGERISQSMSDLLAINVHAPLLFQYGLHTGDVGLKSLAIEGLGSVAPENNVVIRKWMKWVGRPESAADTQALLELNTCYCTPKKCVICNVGRTIISRA